MIAGSASVVSLNPPLRVGPSQILRGDTGRKLGPARIHLRRQQADLPRRQPIRRIAVSGDHAADGLDLGPESYCAVAGRQSALEPPSERLGGGAREGARPARRPPPPRSSDGEDLATACVDERRFAAASAASGRSPRPAASAAVESTPATGIPRACEERPRRADRDPQAGERPGTAPDCDRRDPLPAAGLADGGVDHRQQHSPGGGPPVRADGPSESSVSTRSRRSVTATVVSAVALSKPRIICSFAPSAPLDRDLALVAAGMGDLDDHGPRVDRPRRRPPATPRTRSHPRSGSRRAAPDLRGPRRCPRGGGADRDATPRHRPRNAVRL